MSENFRIIFRVENLKMNGNSEILIKAVIKTLDTIQVQGCDNMQKLMSCMTVLDKVLRNDTSDILIDEKLQENKSDTKPTE